LRTLGGGANEYGEKGRTLEAQEARVSMTKQKKHKSKKYEEYYGEPYKPKGQQKA